MRQAPQCHGCSEHADNGGLCDGAPVPCECYAVNNPWGTGDQIAPPGKPSITTQTAAMSRSRRPTAADAAPQPTAARADTPDAGQPRRPGPTGPNQHRGPAAIYNLIRPAQRRADATPQEKRHDGPRRQRQGAIGL